MTDLARKFPEIAYFLPVKWLIGICKWTGVLLLVLFAAFFVYANWQPPRVGERLYLESPTALAVLSFPAGAVVQEVNDPKIMNVTGVQSYTIATAQQLMAVTYDSRNMDKTKLVAALQSAGLDVKPQSVKSDQPQCPVHGYLYYFYRLKYTLCLRK